MKKPLIPLKPTRTPADRNQGRKSLQGGGKSPVLQISVSVAQRDKLKRLGGATWIRASIDKAREATTVKPLEE